MILGSDIMGNRPKKVILVRYHDKGNINTRLPESLNKVQGVLPPLGIAYIAAFLEQNGVNVSIIDVQGLNMTSAEFAKAIEDKKPDIVAITCMTPTFHGALEAAKMCKKAGATVVLGGSHISVYPKESLQPDFVDFGIVGEGEYTLAELVDALENESDYSTIKGLAYKKDGNVIINQARIVKDIDTLPFPAYHLLPMKKYSSVIGLHPVSTMISSRGCPYRCGFCFKQPSDKVFRTRNPYSVVDEMEMLVTKHGVKEIMFYDDTITVKRSHIEGICNEILKRDLKVKWESPTRIDLVDKELLTLMKKAGCIRLRYGVESGDPRILELMNKKITIDRVQEVFALTKKVGLESFAYFIIGYATETPHTMQGTIDLAKKINPDFVMFTIATPYPQTPLHTLSVTNGLIDPDYWRKFTLGEDVGRMPYLIPDAEEWIKKAYRSFYLRPSFIFKKAKKLRSWSTFKKYCAGAWGLVRFNMLPED